MVSFPRPSMYLNTPPTNFKQFIFPYQTRSQFHWFLWILVYSHISIPMFTIWKVAFMYLSLNSRAHCLNCVLHSLPNKRHRIARKFMFPTSHSNLGDYDYSSSIVTYRHEKDTQGLPSFIILLNWDVRKSISMGRALPISRTQQQGKSMPTFLPAKPFLIQFLISVVSRNPHLLGCRGSCGSGPKSQLLRIWNLYDWTYRSILGTHRTQMFGCSHNSQENVENWSRVPACLFLFPI